MALAVCGLRLTKCWLEQSWSKFRALNGDDWAGRVRGYIAGVIYMILALLNKSPTDLPSMI